MEMKVRGLRFAPLSYFYKECIRLVEDEGLGLSFQACGELMET